MLCYLRGLAILTVLAVLTGCGGAGTSASKPSASQPSSNSNLAPPTNAQTFSNLQQDGGWTGYGEIPPNYSICQSCNPAGPEVTWAIVPGSNPPGLTGKSARFDIGGLTPYSDVLWNDHLIGDLSTQGLPDHNHTLVPTLHNFIVDLSFYGTNLETSQILEFDINQFFDGQGFIWGHQCRIAGGHEWDTWDNVKAHWVPTGIPCNPLSNAWNHLTIQVQRDANNQLLFQSIALNGVTKQLNITRPPGSAPGWYGIVMNYQMDGNYAQQPYSVWLDKFNFTYW